MNATDSHGFVVAALILLALLASRLISRLSRQQVPGPWYARWTSLCLDFHFMRGSRTSYIHGLHQKYGPVIQIGPNEVSITNLNAVKLIYNTKETFHKSRFYPNLAAPGQDSMFLSTDIDFHRRHRRLLASPMSQSSLVSLIPRIETRVRQAIDRISEDIHTNGSVDICRWWLFMATDVIGELTFGDSFRMLDLGVKDKYILELEQVGIMGALRTTFPLIARLAFALPFPLPIFQRAINATLNMRNYATKSLLRYRSLIDACSPQANQTLFTKIFQANNEGKLPFNEIRDEAQSYIIAGSDTTANTLTFLTWAVCRRPRLRDTLVRELQTLPMGYTDDDLCHLTYLNHVIAETLRLYAAIPSSLPRVVPQGGAQLAGYWFDEHTVVSTQAYSMHRNADVFPNPEKFDPSRWSSPNKAVKDHFMPFGRGSRACIGQHLAMIEIRLAVAQFFLAFPTASCSARGGMIDSDMEQKSHFLLASKGGRCIIELEHTAS